MISKELKKRFMTSILLFSLIFLIISFKAVLILTLLVLGVLSLLEFFNMTNKIIRTKLYLFAANLLFILYISFFCIMFFFFSSYLQLQILLFSILLGCAASDVGGFVFGKILRGPKLTKISPNKTFAGVVGSIIFTCFVFSSLIFYFTKDFNYNLLIIATIISISCQIGDLFFSYLKRKAKVKDTGNFLPGHGGILDRLDGIFLGIPIGFLSLTLFY